MTKRMLRFLWSGLIASSLWLPAARPAHADEGKACNATYESGLSLRAKGHLLGARKQFVACSRQTCPAVLSKECLRLAVAVATSIPTVVIDARDAHGDEVANVRVTIDGTQVASQLNGRSIQVDPGERHFRFKLEGGPSVARVVLVHEGEKERVVKVQFPGAPGKAPASSAQKPTAAQEGSTPGASKVPEQPPGHVRHGLPVGAWVLGAVGVAGLGGFTVFAVQGKSQQNQLDRCAPHCQKKDVDAMRRNYLIGDISLGVGVVALAAATWVALSSGSRRETGASRPARRDSLVPSAQVGVGSLALDWRF